MHEEDADLRPFQTQTQTRFFETQIQAKIIFSSGGKTRSLWASNQVAHSSNTRVLVGLRCSQGISLVIML
jgi:hypothetical protein